MKSCLPLFICFFSVDILFAQSFPTGPDWKATDLNGQSHQLYDYLNQGKVVFMDIFATWCPPCYSYHQSGKFKDLYNIYGPNGTDQARVFSIETDPRTGIPQLHGAQPLSEGDYVNGTPYPIIDKPGLNDAYYAFGYPTLYCVCPDRKTFELPHGWSATALWGIVEDSCTNFNFIQTRIDTIVNERCKNEKNGEVRISVLNGVAPYTFLWSNGATTKNISGLSGRNYFCTVTDALGNTGRAGASVPGPLDSFYVNLTKYNQRCITPQGYLSVNGINGMAPYSVVWSTGATTNWQEDLPVGIYGVTVSDALGCVKTMDNLEILPKYEPLAKIAPISPISCAQPVVVLNGTGSTTFPYDSVFWRKPDGTSVKGDSTLTFVATTPGLYGLLLSNFSSYCYSWAYINVGIDTIRPMAEAGPAKQQVCSGTPVTLQGSGSGAGPLTYAWSTPDGNILSGGNTPSPIVSGAGTYSLTVTRTNSGCTRSDATTVSVLNQTPSTQAIATVLTCLTPTGTLTGTSSLPGSTFKWTGPGNYNSTQNPAVVTQPGIYTLTTTAPGGCSATTTVTVMADKAPPQLSVDIPGIITCNQLSINISASVLPVVSALEWNGPNGFSAIGSTIVINQPGGYTVVATAPNGCTAMSALTVTADQVPPQLTVATPGIITCDQLITLLSATASPANAMFNWSGPNGFVATGSQATVSQPGLYTLVVTAPNGCTATSSVVVSAEQSLPVITVQSPGNLSCAQPSLVLNASSPGSVPLLWQWSTVDGHILSGANSPNPVIDAPGTYMVSVTNTLTSCSSQASVSVSSNTPPLVSAAMELAASCPDAADGIAVVNVGLGTPPFAFQWSDGQTTQQATGLSAGTVSVLVSDAAGCTEFLQVEISWSDVVPPLLLCPADKTVSFCHNIVSYDLPVVTDNCVLNALPVLLDGPASGLEFPAGLTTVLYQANDAGTNTATCSFSVTVAAALNMSGIVQADTGAASVGAINLLTDGGLPPYLFVWTKDNLPFADTEDILLAPAGQYAVTVTDAGGCTAEMVFLIPSITAVSDLQNLFGLQLFPNPATDRVMLKTDGRQAMVLKLALYDVRGVLQQEWEMFPDFIDVSAYPAGVYFLQVKSEDGASQGWAKVLVER